MQPKEQVTELSSKVDALVTDVTAIGDDIAALKQVLAEASKNSDLNLQPFIDKAEKIHAGLRVAVAAGRGSDPINPGESVSYKEIAQAG